MSELKATSDQNPRSILRMMLIGIVILIIGFLIFGSLGQPQPEQTGFGLQNQSFMALAVLAFLGGLLSFLSPCTLPILPAYFAFAFQSGRKQILANTVIFMLGLASMFALLGASASLLGRVLLNNQQLLLLIGGSFVLVFGVMSLLGRGFSGMSAQTSDNQVDQRSLWGSFIFGLTFAVGWSSCVGPILGAVLTLAAGTASVANGTMLLFIYALGLGLPLIIVSTFFGRASRKSLFWRIMRGKGWDVNVHMFVVGAIWAFAIWRILVAVGDYAFRNFSLFAGQDFTAVHEIGLLVIALAAVALWIFTTPGDHRTTLHLHSTQTISGLLFIVMGLLLLSSRLATFNSLVPPDLAIWFADIEDKVITFFNG